MPPPVAFTLQPPGVAGIAREVVPCRSVHLIREEVVACQRLGLEGHTFTEKRSGGRCPENGLNTTSSLAENLGVLEHRIHYKRNELINLTDRGGHSNNLRPSLPFLDPVRRPKALSAIRSSSINVR